MTIEAQPGNELLGEQRKKPPLGKAHNTELETETGKEIEVMQQNTPAVNVA